jgi:hypothetical protein
MEELLAKLGLTPADFSADVHDLREVHTIREAGQRELDELQRRRHTMSARMREHDKKRAEVQREIQRMQEELDAVTSQFITESELLPAAIVAAHAELRRANELELALCQRRGIVAAPQPAEPPPLPRVHVIARGDCYVEGSMRRKGERFTVEQHMVGGVLERTHDDAPPPEPRRAQQPATVAIGNTPTAELANVNSETAEDQNAEETFQ